MPLRNLILIAIAMVTSLVCYNQATRNRYSSLITEVMGVVESNYLEPVERRDLFDHAMTGMISRLDPYSGYMPAAEYKPFAEEIDQEFGGIGILVEVNPETKRLTVMSPLFGTPAYEAGIRSGDTIMSINGKDTEGLELREAVKLMKGAPNTQVKVGIKHRGEDDVIDLTLTRRIIQTESVLGDKRQDGAVWDFHLQEDPRIAYLRLESFGAKTAEEVRKALTNKDGTFGDFQAIILDLRGNPGGMLMTAVEISDMFLDSGVIVSTRGRGGAAEAVYEATKGTLVPANVPVVVLVNQYSASASEIVAAALQDHQRATIIGQRTWGKGTVQNVIELDGGKSALRLTTSSYWRPSGVNIHRQKDAQENEMWGVSPTPGFEVKLTDDELRKVLEAREKRDLFRPYEDKPAPTTTKEKKGETKDEESKDEKDNDEAPFDDPQLRKAIEHLQQQLKSAS